MAVAMKDPGREHRNVTIETGSALKRFFAAVDAIKAERTV